MPEGPEIKQIADALATALVGQKLTEVFFAFDHLKPWESVLCGRKVKRVRPRGKAAADRVERPGYLFTQPALRTLVCSRTRRRTPDRPTATPLRCTPVDTLSALLSFRH